MSFERRNRARNSLLSYFMSASSRSFTSRRLLGFITLKNSRISMSVFVRAAIFVVLCKKADTRYQHSGYIVSSVIYLMIHGTNIMVPYTIVRYVQID